jgi:hypothetical protein
VALKNAIAQLRLLQEAILIEETPGWRNEYSGILSWIELNGGLKINFFGSCHYNNFWQMLDLLAQADVAPFVKSLHLDGPDEGANGTNDWDLANLGKGVEFTNLDEFHIRLTQPGDHNQSVISDNTYEENGLITLLIRKMPKLRQLSVPSAPHADFFALPSHPLEMLTVQSGYDIQNFIANLSQAKCFTALRYLDFTDYNQTYLEGYQAHCTPPENFRQLFHSVYLPALKVVTLRDTLATDAELSAMLPSNGISLKTVRTTANYIQPTAK